MRSTGSTSPGVGDGVGGPTPRAAVRVAIAVSLIAWAAGALAAFVPPILAGVLALALGALLGVAARPRDHVALVVALLLATILLGTGLVPDDGRYLPALLVATAIGGAVVRRVVREPRAVALPAWPVMLACAAYLGWVALATLGSTRPRVSAEYLVGAGAALALALVVVPTAVASRDGRRAVVLALGAIGPMLVAAGAILAPLGRLDLFGQSFGPYPMLRVTILGRGTPLIVPRLDGIYFQPGYEAIALAVAILALLALLPEASARARRWLGGGIVVSLIGLVMTFDRNGLLTVAAGSAFLALGTVVLTLARQGVARRLALAGRSERRASPDLRSAVWPGIVAIASGLLFVAVLGNAFGASLPAPATAGSPGPAGVTAPAGAARGGEAPPSAGETVVRGGAGLSGRDEIWRASLDAIIARPLVGSGPGTNAEALVPYLTGDAARYIGLTSHDTWLRTAVEMGLPGLGFLVLFVLSVLWAGWRLLWRGSRDAADLALATVFVALLFAFTFETFLLGGLSYPSIVWAVAAGFLARPDRRVSADVVGLDVARARTGATTPAELPRAG